MSEDDSVDDINHRLESCFTENGRFSYAMRLIVFVGFYMGLSEPSQETESKRKIESILAKYDYPYPPRGEKDIRAWVLKTDLGKLTMEIVAIGKRGQVVESVSKDVTVEGNKAKLVSTEKTGSSAPVIREYTYINLNDNWLLDSWTDM